MPSSYRIRYLLSAPVIVVVGLVAIFWGSRAVAFGGRAHGWADSLDKGSGPVRLDIPFIPIFVNGKRVGSLDTVVIQRHRHGTVDSLRIVVKPLAAANAGNLAACAYHLQNLDQFNPSEFPRALTCAADTTGLTRFGRVTFGGGHEAPLFVDADQVACENLLDTPDGAAVVAPALARTVATSVSKNVSKAVSQSVSRSVAQSASAEVSADTQTVCTQRAFTRAQTRWGQRGISRSQIQRIVRQATDQARQAQDQGRQAREQARRAVEQARQAAEAVKH